MGKHIEYIKNASKFRKTRIIVFGLVGILYTVSIVYSIPLIRYIGSFCLGIGINMLITREK